MFANSRDRPVVTDQRFDVNSFGVPPMLSRAMPSAYGLEVMERSHLSR
jgi:hypothetical protein